MDKLLEKNLKIFWENTLTEEGRKAFNNDFEIFKKSIKQVK